MDFIWDIATSFPVLGIIALILAAALVVGYFPLLKWFPVIGQYVPAARLVVVLAAAALAFLIGFRMSDERADAKMLRAALAAKQIDLEAANDAAEQAKAAKQDLAKQAETDKERIADYEQRLKDRPAPKDDAKGSKCGCALVPDDFSGGMSKRHRSR
jgi:hypothetical protein